MDDKTVWESDAGTFLKIHVRPKSRKRVFLEITEREILANLKSPARGGKANLELLKRLSKLLGLSTGNLRIVKGYKSRSKIILIQGLSTDEVITHLHSF
ncbi:MAG: DUF167 domain-containing protein [Candidatus Thorarchaeota archaeon]|jgi:hypothetical protein